MLPNTLRAHTDHWDRTMMSHDRPVEGYKWAIFGRLASQALHTHTHTHARADSPPWHNKSPAVLSE